MIYRAVELAYEDGDLSEEFFRLSDEQALEYLRTKCRYSTIRLVEKTLKWHWYKTIFSQKTTEPSEKLKSIANYAGRKKLADRIVDEAKIARENVCIVVSKGRDVRKITVPFVHKNGSKRFDINEGKVIYRVMIYIPPEITEAKTIGKIKKIIQEEIG